MARIQLSVWQAALRDCVLGLLHERDINDIKVGTRETRLGDDPDFEPMTGVEDSGVSAAATIDVKAEIPASAAGVSSRRAPEPWVQMSLSIKFKLEGDPFEVWIYPDGAGVLEPGDDWWPFDCGDFESPGALADAVIDHLLNLFVDDGTVH